MICDKCIKALNEAIVGSKTNDGFVAKEVKTHSSKEYFFNGYRPQFIIYVDGEKVRKNKEIVEKEIDQRFVSKFCPACGEKL